MRSCRQYPVHFKNDSFKIFAKKLIGAAKRSGGIIIQCSAQSKKHAAPTLILQISPNNGKTTPENRCTYSVIKDSVLRRAVKPGTAGRDTLAYVVDGLSNTLFTVEVKEPFCWMDPNADVDMGDIEHGITGPHDEGRIGSFHPGGCNCGFFDGAVRFLPMTIDLEVLKAAATRDDGKAIVLPK